MLDYDYSHAREDVIKALLSLDRAYAYKLQEGAGGANLGGYTRGAPLEQFFQGPVMPMSAYEGAYGIGPRELSETQIGKMVDAGLFATNVASRYMLPAGGITLADKGLYDLTAAFGNGADYPEQGQLPLS